MNNVATILQLLEGYDLETEKRTHSVVFLLPTGPKVSAEVTPQVYAELLQAYSLSKPQAPSNGSHAPSVDDDDDIQTQFEHGLDTPVEDPGLTAEQREALQQEVQWELLPDDVLEPLMKLAMKTVQVRPVMTLEEVYELATELNNKLSPEDWEKLRRQEDAKKVVATPPVGVPSWSDGSPIIPNTRHPSRRVATDEKGNPVLGSSSDVDPGELVGGSEVDEDGVASF